MNEQPHIWAPTIILVVSLVSSVALAGVVLFSNPWRRTHRTFAALALNLALWALGVLLIVRSQTPDGAHAAILFTFIVGSVLPALFYHFTTFFPYQRFDGMRLTLAFLYGGSACLALGAFTPWYVAGIEIYPDRAPLVHYGPVFLGMGLLTGVSMVACVGNLIRKLRLTSGVQRRQVEHLLVSFLSVAVLASITNVIAPVLGVGSLELYGPCFIVLMMAGLAYTMIRYHLMDIWVIISATTVYAMVTGLVTVTFLATVGLVRLVFRGGDRGTDFITTALAALVIVIILQPIKERLQLLLDRLLMHRRYDVNALLERVSRCAAESVNLDQLLERVAEDVRRTVGVKRLRVFLLSETTPGELVIEYSTRPGEVQLHDINQDFLLEHIEKHPEPMVLEKLLHGRPTAETMRLAEHLAELDAWMLVPLRTTSRIVGMMALGEKTTRDIYLREEVQIFGAIAVSLATAIQNARLYRKLKEVNLHLERIMSGMRGGVIVVDLAGVVTTANQEARELLGDVRPGKPMADLEPKVAELLRHTLEERRGIGDVETVVAGADGEPIPVAMSSSVFDTTDDETLGAMVLIFNMAQIKRLESNVQRADRLTSIGTMAAGMAHEIKNPLQSIKTFTQLLPMRFEDPDFRRTFCEVVPPEVQRIDNIVSRLLDFARPKPVHFAPHDLRTIIRRVLALVDNQLGKSGVRVVTDFPDTVETVYGDEQRLHQVVLNLVLNALSAMQNAQERVLAISVEYGRVHLTRNGRLALFDTPCVKITVSDTGCGITQEHMDHIFTPFFTTKSDGSGLGLPVVHGIVTEHGGQIDVITTLGVGTSFIVTLPLLREMSQMLERVGA
jgi:two-component system nitrogen regulation sensor histidine kinase GlnL